MLHSYSSIFAMGHKAVKELLKGEVLVEEKIDGSQFSFGLTQDGLLKCRSKGVEQDINNPDKMFSKAVETVKGLKDFLTPGWVYRCEYLRTNKHNVLTYDTTPPHYLVVFDIEVGLHDFLPYKEKRIHAQKLELLTVPKLFEGVLTLEKIELLLEYTSFLGGPKIEGIVIKPKNYDLYGLDKKVLMSKYVREEFKEAHKREIKKEKEGQDIIALLASQYCTEARWQKSYQHLRDNGQLSHQPKDIGLLMREAQRDIVEECGDEIKEQLFRWAMKNKRLATQLTRGLPEWYKKKLLEESFTYEP